MPVLKLLHPHLPPHLVAAASGYLTLPHGSPFSPPLPDLLLSVFRGPERLIFIPISFTTPDFFHPPWFRGGFFLWSAETLYFFFILNSRTWAQLWERILFIHAFSHSCIHSLKYLSTLPGNKATQRCIWHSPFRPQRPPWHSGSLAPFLLHSFSL